jgi:hypothetical protein
MPWHKVRQWHCNCTVILVLSVKRGILSNKGTLEVKMPNAIGKKRWAIAEGYIPTYGHGKEPEFTSHETACLLNVSDQDAHIILMIYFSNRDPAGPFSIDLPARRTKHLRFNDLTDPEVIPKGTDYSSLFESDVPIVVQHTRLDSRQAENALLSTIAYSE